VCADMARQGGRRFAVCGYLRVIAQANTALKTINTPKSGTLSMLDDTILQGRLTIDAVNKVTIHEQNQLSTLDGDIAETFGNANATLVTLNGTLTTANGSIADLTRSANGVLDTTNTTIGQPSPSWAAQRCLWAMRTILWCRHSR